MFESLLESIIRLEQELKIIERRRWGLNNEWLNVKTMLKYKKDLLEKGK